MNIVEVIENQWFWTFWGTFGAYMMLAMKQKKIALPFFGDIATTYFGITFFLIGFMVQFSFMNAFVNALGGNNSVGLSTLYYIIIALIFIFTVKSLFRTKWFRPFGFIITSFFAGLLARSLYEFIWGV
ncbi:MAG TPA: hypothetical protein ENI33_02165 [Thermoplasmatales archaeon]|nr:hypothetical protein [Thermoplasmatales archaeon]